MSALSLREMPGEGMGMGDLLSSLMCGMLIRPAAVISSAPLGAPSSSFIPPILAVAWNSSSISACGSVCMRVSGRKSSGGSGSSARNYWTVRYWSIARDGVAGWNKEKRKKLEKNESRVAFHEPAARGFYVNRLESTAQGEGATNAKAKIGRSVKGGNTESGCIWPCMQRTKPTARDRREGCLVEGMEEERRWATAVVAAM